MTRDTNDILREEGPDALRSFIDAAKPYRGANHVERDRLAAAIVRDPSLWANVSDIVKISDFPPETATAIKIAIRFPSRINPIVVNKEVGPGCDEIRRLYGLEVTLNPAQVQSLARRLGARQATSEPEQDGPRTSDKQPNKMRWLDMSNWDHEPVPERKWAIRDRVPLNQAGLFSGEGGTGKSIIELMKDVAHVAGKDWFGSMPECGPAFYIGAEDDADELHIRLAAIAGHHNTTFKELIDGGLHVLCLLGQDATLCAAGKSGKVEVTDLYRQLFEAAGDIKPKNISIDTLSRAFAGNEIDRVEVYAFAMHMQALAMVAGGSVTILSHPSLQGITSGSGISGSTAWHGAFRFRQYLKSIKAEGGEQPDSDLRELEFKKNQYGPKAEAIVLRFQRGLFLPEGGVSGLEKLAGEQRTDETFMTLFGQFERQGRNVSDKPTANAYAPTIFAKEDGAKTQRLRKPDLEAAMRRLFVSDKIHVASYGRPSRRASKLAAGPPP